MESFIMLDFVAYLESVATLYLTCSWPEIVKDLSFFLICGDLISVYLIVLSDLNFVLIFRYSGSFPTSNKI